MSDQLGVVTLGETMLRFSPPLGETLESASTLQVDPGGAESNVAVALARLGLRVGWMSRVPDNALGQRVVGEIRRHGVDTSCVIWAPGYRMGGVAQGLAWGTALAGLKRTYRGDLLWASPEELRTVLDGPGQNIVR